MAAALRRVWPSLPRGRVSPGYAGAGSGATPWKGTTCNPIVFRVSRPRETRNSTTHEITERHPSTATSRRGCLQREAHSVSGALDRSGAGGHTLLFAFRVASAVYRGGGDESGSAQAGSRAPVRGRG